MRVIHLSQGRVSLVSDKDYARVSQFDWCVSIPDKIRPYAVRSVLLPNGRKSTQRLHRFILNAPSHVEVDHINGDSLDNRRENLRIVTSSQNKMNCRKSRECSSVFKGVTWAESRWKAQLKFQRKNFYLGYFSTETAAARAYDEKAKEVFGEFACLNFK